MGGGGAGEPWFWSDRGDPRGQFVHHRKDAIGGNGSVGTPGRPRGFLRDAHQHAVELHLDGVLTELRVERPAGGPWKHVNIDTWDVHTECPLCGGRPLHANGPRDGARAECRPQLVQDHAQRREVRRMGRHGESKPPP